MKTSHLDSHTKNDVKLEMLSGVQPGNRIPHDRYNVRGIAHARSYNKDDIFMPFEPNLTDLRSNHCNGLSMINALKMTLYKALGT